MRLGATQVAVALLCLWVLVRPAAAQGRDLPAHVYFVANEGQWDGAFLFKMQAGNATYFITETGMTIDLREYDRTARVSNGRGMAGLDFEDPFNRDEPEPVAVRGHVLKMNFVGANAHPEIVGEDKLSHYSNYFLGNDSCKWRSRVSHYQKVIARDVWNGIDVEFVADAHGVKTNYHVQPMADLSQIQIEYEGLDQPLRVNGSGDLVLTTSLGDLKEQAPWGYQIENRRQQNKEIALRLRSDTQYGFSCEAFDAGNKLVIDPLVYSTFWAGFSDDFIVDMEADCTGNIVICGYTFSSDYPVTPGAYEETREGWAVSFLTKFNSAVDSLVYSTFMNNGGASYLFPQEDGSIVFVGGGNEEWPITEDAIDTTAEGISENVIAVLSQDGTALLFSTFYGGSEHEFIGSVAMDTVGNVYIAGSDAFSSDLPVTANALYPTADGVTSYLAVINVIQPGLVYATYWPSEVNGGQLFAIAASSPHDVWIGGHAQSLVMPITENALQTTFTGPASLYLANVDVIDSELRYGTFMGDFQWDHPNGFITYLWENEPQRVGLVATASTLDGLMPPGGYQEQPRGGYDVVLILFDPPNSIVYGTYLGGSSEDYDYVPRTGVSRASDGSITICGKTGSDDFPVTQNAFDSTFGGGPEWYQFDAFLARLSPDFRTLQYSTYLGGSDFDQGLSLVEVGLNYYVAGETASDDFPITPSALVPSRPSHVWTGFITVFDLTDELRVRTVPITPPNDFDIRLTAFPNPFNSVLTVRLSVSQPIAANIEVYNVQGQLIDSQNLGSLISGEHDIRYSLDQSASGPFWLRVNTSTGRSASTKVVLAK